MHEHILRAVEPLLDRLLTPALVVDLDATRHNLEATVDELGGPRRWRPHVKTAKQQVVVTAMVDAGIREFKCATLRELSLVLESAPAPVHVLLAHPQPEPGARAALRLADRHPGHTVQLLADGPEHLRALDRWVAAAGASAEVALDVDLGMHRTGTEPAQWRAAAQGDLLGRLEALRVTGLHGYDGHLSWEDREEAHRGHDALCDLADALPIAAEALELVTSGSHGWAHAKAHPRLWEGPWKARVSPGTLVFSDLRTAPAAEAIGLRQAAFVLSRVVSRGPGRVTLDAGSKAISPDVPAPNCRIEGWPGLQPLGASEEHLPVRVTAGQAPALGAPLLLTPAHVCTTVNLHRRALLVEGGEVVGESEVGGAGHPVWADQDPLVGSREPRA